VSVVDAVKEYFM